MPDPDGRDETMPELRSHSLRDVPWRWRDLVVGMAPIVVAQSALYLARSSPIGLTLRTLWVPLTVIAMTWLLAFPLWVARRRAGALAFPTARAVVIEGIVAALVVPLALASMAAMAAMLTSLLGPGATATPSLEPLAASPRRSDWMALAVLAVAAAPVAEEVFFRGMVYNALRRRVRPALAAFIQAVAFALFHPFGAAERAIIGVIGFITALLYERRKRLVAPIFLHAFLNVIGVGLMFWTVAAVANAPVLGVRVEPHEGGCLVTTVGPGGAAEAAGIRVGDVIQSAGEYAVATQRDLVLVLSRKKAGDTIPVDFLRNGEPHRVEAVLKARPR